MKISSLHLKKKLQDTNMAFQLKLCPTCLELQTFLSSLQSAKTHHLSCAKQCCPVIYWYLINRLEHSVNMLEKKLFTSTSHIGKRKKITKTIFSTWLKSSLVNLNKTDHSK